MDAKTLVFNEDGKGNSGIGGKRQQDADRIRPRLSRAVALLQDVQPRIRDNDRCGTAAVQRQTDRLSGFDLQPERLRRDYAGMSSIPPRDAGQSRRNGSEHPGRGPFVEDSKTPVLQAENTGHPDSILTQRAEHRGLAAPAEENGVGRERDRAGQGLGIDALRSPAPFIIRDDETNVGAVDSAGVPGYDGDHGRLQGGPSIHLQPYEFADNAGGREQLLNLPHRWRRGWRPGPDCGGDDDCESGNGGCGMTAHAMTMHPSLVPPLHDSIFSSLVPGPRS